MIERDHIKKIAEGNQNNFRFFVDTYSSDLYHFSFGFVKSKEIADEIVSDVFFDVWQNRSGLELINNIKSWLLVLTRNKSISYLRKEKGDIHISFDEIEDYQAPEIQSPDYDIISKEEITRINNAIAKLPPKCQIIFTLAKIQGLPYKEIAEMLDISVKTINVHIARAIELISDILEKK